MKIIQSQCQTTMIYIYIIMTTVFGIVCGSSNSYLESESQFYDVQYMIS